MSLFEDLGRALGPTTTLGSELPRGGMSQVFEGFAQTLQRRSAGKAIAPYLTESLSIDRFRREIMLVPGSSIRTSCRY